MRPNTRDNSMDLLRLLSCLAVVLLHVNAQYFVARSATPSPDFAYTAESLTNIIARFSVPAFVLISGAFVLGKQQNANAQQFYQKSFRKIFLPLAPAIILFAAYDRLVKGIGLKWIFLALVTGKYYNLWFMLMLLCLYALVPVLVRVKAALPWRWWGRLGFVLLAWAVVSQAASSHDLPYDIGVVGSYLGYFITGNFLYDNRRRLNFPPVALCISLTAALVAGTFIVRYRGLDYYLFDANRSFFSPSVVVMSLLIFITFCQTQVRRSLQGSATLAYYVYVFHTFVYTLLLEVLGDASHELRTIALVFLLTVVVSFAIAKLYASLWDHLVIRLA